MAQPLTNIVWILAQTLSEYWRTTGTTRKMSERYFYPAEYTLSQNLTLTLKLNLVFYFYFLFFQLGLFLGFVLVPSLHCRCSDKSWTKGEGGEGALGLFSALPPTRTHRHTHARTDTRTHAQIHARENIVLITWLYYCDKGRINILSFLGHRIYHFFWVSHAKPTFRVESICVRDFCRPNNRTRYFSH